MSLANSSQIGQPNLRWYLIAILPGCWSIFGSRWGSYLPREPFFLNDLLILILVLSSIFSRKIVTRKRKFTIYLVYFSYLFIKLLFSNWQEPLTLLRDYIPYIYLVTAPLIALRIKTANSRVSYRLERFMEWCIVGHTLWTVISFYYPELIERLPLTNVTQEVHFFTIRADFDAAIMSVFIAMVIFGRINVINRRTQVLLLIFGSGFILLQGNRASFISFSLLIFIALKFNFSVVVNYYAKGVLRILILFFAFLGILGISQLTIGEKFIGVTASLSNHQSELAGAGTASARIAAWTQVAQYINSSQARVWFGVGFGSDYMQDSGALRALVNAEQGARNLPRQPHNYWLNTYARLGIIGTGILLILLSQVLMIAAKILRRPNDFGNEQLMASLIFVSLIPVATFGVVLESPFGALALAMSNGFLLSKR